MLTMKVTSPAGLILLGWLLINLAYGSNDQELHCILKQKPTEINFVCLPPGIHKMTNYLEVLKYSKKLGEYKQRFSYKMSDNSMFQWDEKTGWKSLRDFQDDYPDKTYMEPSQLRIINDLSAQFKMSNIAPEGTSTIIQ
jgi:hypothetical protein